MKEGSAGYRGSPRLVLGHLAQISMNNTEQQALFIIFGGTGDLAQRKLYPSLFNLYKRGYLKNHFAVIGTARRPWTDEHYHEVIKESIANMSDDEEQADDFASHFYYQSPVLSGNVAALFRDDLRAFENAGNHYEERL